MTRDELKAWALEKLQPPDKEAEKHFNAGTNVFARAFLDECEAHDRTRSLLDTLVDFAVFKKSDQTWWYESEPTLQEIGPFLTRDAAVESFVKETESQARR